MLPSGPLLASPSLAVLCGAELPKEQASSVAFQVGSVLVFFGLGPLSVGLCVCVCVRINQDQLSSSNYPATVPAT